MIPRIKVTNMELTPAIEEYLIKRLETIEKHLWGDYDSAKVDIEIAQTTLHHQQGPIFKCELTVALPHGQFRAESTQENLYTAIDEVKDELKRQLIETKNKHKTLTRKGQLMFKRMLRFGRTEE